MLYNEQVSYFKVILDYLKAIFNVSKLEMLKNFEFRNDKQVIKILRKIILIEILFIFRFEF